MFKGTRPDITAVQVAAAFGWIVAQFVAFGVLDTARSQTILSAGSTLILAVFPIADAYLRGKRNEAAAPPPTTP